MIHNIYRSLGQAKDCIKRSLDQAKDCILLVTRLGKRVSIGVTSVGEKDCIYKITRLGKRCYLQVARLGKRLHPQFTMLGIFLCIALCQSKTNCMYSSLGQTRKLNHLVTAACQSTQPPPWCQCYITFFSSSLKLLKISYTVFPWLFWSGLSDGHNLIQWNALQTYQQILD